MIIPTSGVIIEAAFLPSPTDAESAHLELGRALRLAVGTCCRRQIIRANLALWRPKCPPQNAR